MERKASLEEELDNLMDISIGSFLYHASFLYHGSPTSYLNLTVLKEL